MFCGYHFKLECPFLLRFGYNKQQSSEEGPSISSGIAHWYLRVSRVSRGLTGTAVGHRATTLHRDTAISSRRYVCPGVHRFLHRGGEDIPTSEKSLTQENQDTRVYLSRRLAAGIPQWPAPWLFQPSPDPQVLAKGGEVICHRMSSLIRS